ncbi:MAG TPA: DUF2190 family protein [Steroidobacteraceae bacterium]|nr:DUF2190 family protein [Steroidobacteraceae bacterium]
MAKNHVQPGIVIAVTLAATYASGDLIKVGQRAGVCLKGGDADDEVSVQIDEVFTVKKATGVTIAVGDQLYLDAANKQVTTATDDGGSPAVSFIPAGIATSAAADAATTVNCKLNA